MNTEENLWLRDALAILQMRIQEHEHAYRLAAYQDSNGAVFNFSVPLVVQDDALQGGSVNGQCPPRQYLPISNHHLSLSCGLEEQ